MRADGLAIRLWPAELAEGRVGFLLLGGGTALMVHTGHRLSKDIDAFIDDPQYLSILSPRLGGEGIWDHQAYDEAANYLKLYPEGEIDFIVASYITNVPTAQNR